MQNNLSNKNYNFQLIFFNLFIIILGIFIIIWNGNYLPDSIKYIFIEKPQKIGVVQTLTNEISGNIIKYNNSIITFADLYKNCQQITNIPDGLFGNIEKVEDVDVKVENASTH